MVDGYARHDALALAALIRRGELTASEALEAAIARAEAANPRLNAIVHALHDDARARASSVQPGDGPFAGVPTLVKDLGPPLAGAPLTMGSRLYRAFVPPADGELIRRIRAAGFLVMGKTSTPEFGLLPVTEPELFGPCRNPWDPSRTPGGSSGGSAAAVAAGIVPLAHASDGGGSIRIPASCCGLFGLKPSRGLPPTEPAAAGLLGGLTVEHALTRSVRDSAAFLDATRNRDPTEPPDRPSFAKQAALDPPRPLRVALFRGAMLGSSVHPDCAAALDDAARLLADLGHAVEEAAPDGIDWPAIGRAFLVLFAAGPAHLLSLAPDLVGRAARRSDVEATTWAMAAVHRRALNAQDTADALAVQARTARAMAAFHERFDVLLTPTLAAPPPPVGALSASPAERLALRAVTALSVPSLLRAALARGAARAFGWAAFTAPFNLTGQPAASVPLFWNAAGLPIGVQLAARHGGDATLLRLAGQLERARPWGHRRPPLFPA